MNSYPKSTNRKSSNGAAARAGEFSPNALTGKGRIVFSKTRKSSFGAAARAGEFSPNALAGKGRIVFSKTRKSSFAPFGVSHWGHCVFIHTRGASFSIRTETVARSARGGSPLSLVRRGRGWRGSGSCRRPAGRSGRRRRTSRTPPVRSCRWSGRSRCWW